MRVARAGFEPTSPDLIQATFPKLAKKKGAQNVRP